MAASSKGQSVFIGLLMNTSSSFHGDVTMYRGLTLTCQGCAAHLQAQKWNGSSKGIVKSCFWAFARIGRQFPRIKVSFHISVQRLIVDPTSLARQMCGPLSLAERRL